jgi:hypothetical protein
MPSGATLLCPGKYPAIMATFMEQRLTCRATKASLLQLRESILDHPVWLVEEGESVCQVVPEGEHRMLHIEKVVLSRLESLEDDVLDKFKSVIQWDNKGGDWSGEPLHLLLENRQQAQDLIQ